MQRPFDETTSQSSDQLDIVFYDPEQSSRASNQEKARPRWQKLADRIGTARGKAAERLQVSVPLSGCPSYAESETPLSFASQLAQSITTAMPEVALQELLFMSLCSVLSVSGRASPEELDQVISTVVKSTNHRYLDRLKRGAKMANEIIAEWAADGISDTVQRLDRATQAVLQGAFDV